MDKESAKEFLFLSRKERKIYISKNLQELLDMNKNELFWIYAVLETESGETLMKMDWSYSGEPIIMERFIHLDFFLKFHSLYKIIRI